MAEEYSPNQVPTIDELVNRWTDVPGDIENPGDTLKYGATRNLLHLLSRKLYADYQPFPEGPQFLERLARWLDNLRDDEAAQQLLFEFVPWLLFIGRHEMETMYRAAFTGPISRWIIDDAELGIADPELPEKFAAAVRKTFFGHMAGMDIGSFARVNSLSGQSDRPEFRVLSRYGDFDEFRNGVTTKGFDRIVAVEDMVGTGTQMLEACPILSHVDPIEVLLCPIVVAPAGVRTWLDNLKPYNSHMTFSPLFVIPPNATLPEVAPTIGEHPLSNQFRTLINDTWNAVQGSNPSPQLQDGPFGFGRFGSLVLSYLNCPDNVPALVHYESECWKPLFPRVSREG